MIVFAVGFLAVLALVVVLAIASVRAPRRSWARRLAGLGAVGIAGIVAFTLWAIANPRMQPLEPDLPFALGVRLDGDDVLLWSGERCQDVDRVIVRFSVKEPRRTAELRLEGEGSATVTGPFSVREMQEDPVAPLEVVEELPDDLDPARYERISLSGAGNGSATLRPVLDGSSDHPDEYWFGDDLGWMSLEEAAQRDGENFYSLCAPDVRYE